MTEELQTYEINLWLEKKIIEKMFKKDFMQTLKEN